MTGSALDFERLLVKIDPKIVRTASVKIHALVGSVRALKVFGGSSTSNHALGNPATDDALEEQE